MDILVSRHCDYLYKGIHKMSIPLHRIRFYDHTPSPITAIQYTPLPLPAPSSTPSQTPPAHPGDCIIARENGHVEIWKHVSDKQIDSYGNWVLYKVSLMNLEL